MTAPPRPSLLRSGLLALVLASAGNLILYALSVVARDASFRIVAPGGNAAAQIGIGQILVAGGLAVLGAMLLMACLRRFSANPNALFRLTALIFLLLSLMLPLSVTADRATRSALIMMNIVTCLAILLAFTPFRRMKMRRPSASSS